MILTKEQMVDWIADKTGQREDDERAAAGRFLDGRLRMMWERALWLDALMEVPATLSAKRVFATLPMDETDHVRINLGTGVRVPVDRVAARYRNGPLPPSPSPAQDPFDVEIFARNSGSSDQFTASLRDYATVGENGTGGGWTDVEFLIPPDVNVTQLRVGESFVNPSWWGDIASLELSHAGEIVAIYGFDEPAEAGDSLDGRRLDDASGNGWHGEYLGMVRGEEAADDGASGLVRLPPVAERVLGARLSDLALDGDAIEMRYRVDHDRFAEDGDPVAVSELGQAVWLGVEPARLSVRVFGSFEGCSVAARYVDEAGRRRSETLVCGSPGAGGYWTGTLARRGRQVEALTPEKADMRVRLLRSAEDGGAGDVVAEGEAGRASADLERPLWLRVGERPAENTQVKLLVKARTPDWGDREPPPIRGAENALLAFALGDMEQRQRQFARANEYFAEGTQLLQNLMAAEADQTVERSRLIPTPVEFDYEWEEWL